MNSFFHCIFHDLRGFAPVVDAVREVETGLGDLFCLVVVGQQGYDVLRQFFGVAANEDFLAVFSA